MPHALQGSSQAVQATEVQPHWRQERYQIAHAWLWKQPVRQNGRLRVAVYTLAIFHDKCTVELIAGAAQAGAKVHRIQGLDQILHCSESVSLTTFLQPFCDCGPLQL